MKILSLFDGISCARAALERAGIEVDEYFSSEVDKYAIQIAQKNYPDTIQLGDIKDIQSKSFNYWTGIYKEIDLIIGGSPCQDLSIAKKNREGLKGCRSGLFYEFVRLIKEIKPKYFILENVNSMPKEAKKEITSQLWGIEPIVINAALVSAQNRKKLFWVGKLVGDKYEQVAITQPKDKGFLLKDILEKDVDEKYITKMDFTKRFDYSIHKTPFENKSQALRATDYKGTHNMVRIGQLGKGGQGDRIYSPEGKSVNLSANGGGRGAKTGLYAVALRNRGEGKKPEIGGAKANAMTTVQTDSMIMKDTIIRKLTPIECERLQGLPDRFTEKGINEKGEEVLISNTQRYKCLGNAFNVDVIAHILNFTK